jgi:4-amino-4-deoxy-L-arabinose transferase-like glycosyltransferase
MTEAALRSKGVAWQLWLFLGLLWLATLPWRPLFDPDEGRYAEIPREMMASGDWVTPRLNGLPYFEKPPLQYWATATAYSAFGVSEWTARLWADALGFLGIPLVYGFARAIGRPRELALAAAAVLALSPYFGIIGHLNLLDQAFSFFLAASVFAFVLGQREAEGSGRERGWMLCAWAALALSVLSKGIASIVLVGATLVVHMVLSRDLRVLRRMHFVPGLAAFAAITVPWFWLVQARNPDFAGFFFLHEHFERFLTAVHRRTEPWWYFPAILLVALTPALPSLPAAVKRSLQDDTAAGFPVGRVLAIWCGVVFVFFSVSQSKLAPYILPMMPALSLLVADAVHENRRSRTQAAIALAVTLLVFGIGLDLYCRRQSGAIAPGVAAWTLVAVLAGLLPLAAGFLRKAARSESAEWLLLAAASMIGYQALFMAYADLPRERTAKAMAMQIGPRIAPGTELYAVGQYRPSLSFYLERRFRVVAYVGEFEFGFTRGGDTAMLDMGGFRQRWNASPDAVAVIEPKTYAQLAAEGLPGQVIASDGRSVAVSRR